MVSKNVLVTGGSGFIGSFLVDELVNRGYNVTILDLDEPKFGLYKQARFIKGSVTSEDDINRAVNNQEFVFHLAGLLGTHELVERAYEATMVNIGGSIRILDGCRKFGAKLISISKPNCWVNPYTITKIAVEGYVEMYRREFGVESAIVKWFNVYGGRQPLFEGKGYRKAVPTWIVNALGKHPLEIYGNGEQTMDLIYTADVIEATLTVVDHWGMAQGQTFEVGSGEEVSANRLAEIIKKQTKSDSGIVHVPMRPGETENTRIKADLERMATLGWMPSTSLDEGIRQTIEWYQLHPLFK